MTIDPRESAKRKHQAKNNSSNVHSLNTINIKPVGFKEFIDKSYEPLMNLLSPWFQKAGLNMVVAEAGAGKTYFCLNVAFALASGAQFLEYKAPKPVKVLYIDGEMRGAVLQSRLITIAKHYPTFIPENLEIITPDNMPSFIVPKICQPNTQAWINDLIKENKFDVVFFDNLSTLSTVDENMGNEWNVIQDWFIRIRADGCGIVLVHHTGDNVEKQRGSSKRKDILDTVILLKKGHTSTNDIPLHFNISYHKSRNFYGTDAMPFDALMTKEGSWIMKDSVAAITDVVIEYSGLKMTQQEIAKTLHISQPTVCRIIKEAKKMGKL